SSPPPMPALPVRIGDVTRPDDGVLGCFIPGKVDADARFVPVSKEAADKAVLNGLLQGLPVGFNAVPVKHPFIKDQINLFPISPNQPRDLIILVDVRGGLYATCGVLPRKKITMPREFLEAGLRNLEPTFRVGPVLTAPGDGSVRPL